jgi:hypothetical protein
MYGARSKEFHHMQPYHIFPDFVMKQLPGYVSNEAPAVALPEQVGEIVLQTQKRALEFYKSKMSAIPFKELFTIVAGSFLKAGISQQEMREIVGFAADWFLKHPQQWTTALNPVTGCAWLDLLEIL